MNEPTHFFIDLQRPGGHGRTRWGVTDEGWYVIEDGRVILTDAAGTPRLNYEGQPRSAELGTQNARQVAARLLREQRSEPGRPQGFGRALRYGPTGAA